MSNMSYCRFTNTRSDLADCLDAICENKRLSDFEARAGRNMFKEFLDFCQEHDLIDAYDREQVDALFHSLQERSGDDDE